MAEPTDVRVVSEERRAYLAQKKREQRAKAKAQGKCTVCARNPADPGLVSCKACRENIVAWQRKNGWPGKGADHDAAAE